MLKLALATVLLGLGLVACSDTIKAPSAPAAVATQSVTEYASGLTGPRGLAFGPDGKLYVALAGTGGSNTTTPAQCEQVPAPVGPYGGGTTASIVSIDASGSVTTVADNLPSAGDALPSKDVLGVADVAFIGDTLYALIQGGGCSHGNPGFPNSVVKVNADGSTTMIANLSAFYKAHPVAHPEAEDFEPDGTPYSMVAVRGALYVVEANHGEVDRVTPDGAITRVVDVSAFANGHIVPTSIGYHGNFFVGNLGTFPTAAGSESVFKLTPSGQMMAWINGLTTVLGVAFDHDGRMYVLETTTVDNGPAPATGDIVRVSRSGAHTVIASGLNFPTAMTFGPDGALYVSESGFGAAPGTSSIVRIEP
ncbi:MAG: ScyD/ScyE family protein [Deinococcales bacterium]